MLKARAAILSPVKQEFLLLSNMFFISCRRTGPMTRYYRTCHRGNGDTSLLLFGRHVTPNHHALAENFVLLDNFYVDGEVSADGQ